MKKSLIVIVGPTASGKTDLAIRLARHFGTEIISADSRQFYKEIPIGTAAPEPEDLDKVRHHFVGHLSINDEYNVSRFEQDVLKLLKELYHRLNTLVMVGGSGLYIDAVCRGIDDLPDPNPAIRAELRKLMEEKGLAALQDQLRSVDPGFYKTVDLRNPKRLMRAIEVSLQTGKPYSTLRKNQPKKRDFHIIKIGLEVPREILDGHIRSRTKAMIEKGWLEEVRRVFPYRDLNALNTVGYKELFMYLDGVWSLDQALEKINTNTRRYAKRQMTWFRKENDITWFNPEDFHAIQEHVEHSLNLT
ncbi:MAG: tRNA (adenosine(37)-N6)-dimethylallyltransferase MiaA [bacterium]